ncbi:MAG: hypothetical protein WAN35_15295 [Terracidiphilus sp.]
MRAQNIGRALGVGLRVAGRIAGERLAAGTQSASATSTAASSAGVRGETGRCVAGQMAGRATGGLARGVGGFLRPFHRIGAILWLEITGVFFLLPVVVFAPRLWATRANWAHGPDHWRFLVTAAVMALFLYLSVSSFWRARKR